jgi:hypothetical protein
MDKSKEILMNNWAIVSMPLSLYKAPECYMMRLQGEITEHHTIPINKSIHKVFTSPIVEVDRTLVTTQSGTKYRLGNIDPDYLQLMNINKITYNNDNTIMIIK